MARATVDYPFAAIPLEAVGDPDLPPPAFELYCLLVKLAFLRKSFTIEDLRQELAKADPEQPGQPPIPPGRRSVYRWLTAVETAGWMSWTRGKADSERFLLHGHKQTSVPPVTHSGVSPGSHVIEVAHDRATSDTLTVSPGSHVEADPPRQKAPRESGKNPEKTPEESHESTSTTTTHAEPASGGGGGARLLAAEGFSKTAIKAFGHYPAEILAADIQRRRALGQGIGAIVNAWKVAPPDTAPLVPAAATGSNDQVRQDVRVLAARQERERAELPPAPRRAPARASPDARLRPVWQAALATLQAATPAAEFDTWLRPATLAGLDAGVATVAAPSPDHAAALRSRYLTPLRRALGDALGAPVHQVTITP